MKYLQDYMSDKQTKAFNNAGAFFAFSNEQLEKRKKQGVKYANMGGGLVCPIDNCNTLKNELEKIYKEAIKQDIQENGLNAIIRRELNNHECYYTGNIDDCVEELADYPVTETDILKVYRNKNHEISI